MKVSSRVYLLVGWATAKNIKEFHTGSLLLVSHWLFRFKPEDTSLPLGKMFILRYVAITLCLHRKTTRKSWYSAWKLNQVVISKQIQGQRTEYSRIRCVCSIYFFIIKSSLNCYSSRLGRTKTNKQMSNHHFGMNAERQQNGKSNLQF